MKNYYVVYNFFGLKSEGHKDNWLIYSFDSISGRKEWLLQGSHNRNEVHVATKKTKREIEKLFGYGRKKGFFGNVKVIDKSDWVKSL